MRVQLPLGLVQAVRLRVCKYLAQQLLGRLRPQRLLRPPQELPMLRATQQPELPMLPVMLQLGPPLKRVTRLAPPAAPLEPQLTRCTRMPPQQPMRRVGLRTRLAPPAWRQAALPCQLVQRQRDLRVVKFPRSFAGVSRQRGRASMRRPAWRFARLPSPDAWPPSQCRWEWVRASQCFVQLRGRAEPPWSGRSTVLPQRAMPPSEPSQARLRTWRGAAPLAWQPCPRTRE